MNSEVTRSIRLPARVKNLEKLMEFILNLLKETGIGEKEASDIHLAADEACTNVINYAYPEDAKKDIEVTFRNRADAIEIEIRDWGRPFNPLQAPPPDLNLELEERPIGGLGIFLMKKFTDRVEYRREDGSNLLTIVKNTE
mgnify:CR=1 FL=1